MLNIPLGFNSLIQVFHVYKVFPDSSFSVGSHGGYLQHSYSDILLLCWRSTFSVLNSHLLACHSAVTHSEIFLQLLGLLVSSSLWLAIWDCQISSVSFLAHSWISWARWASYWSCCSLLVTPSTVKGFCLFLSSYHQLETSVRASPLAPETLKFLRVHLWRALLKLLCMVWYRQDSHVYYYKFKKSWVTGAPFIFEKTNDLILFIWEVSVFVRLFFEDIY